MDQSVRTADYSITHFIFYLVYLRGFDSKPPQIIHPYFIIGYIRFFI